MGNDYFEIDFLTAFYYVFLRENLIKEEIKVLKNSWNNLACCDIGTH